MLHDELAVGKVLEPSQLKDVEVVHILDRGKDCSGGGHEDYDHHSQHIEEDPSEEVDTSSASHVSPEDVNGLAGHAGQQHRLSDDPLLSALVQVLELDEGRLDPSPVPPVLLAALPHLVLQLDDNQLQVSPESDFEGLLSKIQTLDRVEADECVAAGFERLESFLQLLVFELIELQFKPILVSVLFGNAQRGVRLP